MGYRPQDLWHRGTPESPAGAAQPQEIRVCRNRGRTIRHRTRPRAVSEERIVERGCHRRGDRVVKDAELQRKAAIGSLLLSGASKPAGSTSFRAFRAAGEITLTGITSWPAPASPPPPSWPQSLPDRQDSS